MIRFFSEHDIRQEVSMKQAIALMKNAFVQLSNKEATIPIRTHITTSDHAGSALYMPSYSPSYSLFGLKMVSVFAGNRSSGMPVIQGNMMVMDSRNGKPLAILEAGYLTALRTGAASGLATETLSRQNSTVLALFGTGAQAETQLEGILNVRPINKVIVYASSIGKAAEFVTNMQKKYSVDFIHSPAPQDLLEADIICCATTSHAPVFKGEHVRPGTHINGIGSFLPGMQEVPEDIVQKSLLVVDQRDAVLKEAGDIIIPLSKGLIDENHIHAELGELVSGKTSGRSSREQITLFKSVGNAIQDLAIANYLIKKS